MGDPLMTRTLASASLALSSLLALPVAAAAQETDHLACIAVKDNPDAVPEGPLPVAISDVLEDEFSDCAIKKVRMSTLCIRVAKDGGDDPLAGEASAEAYGCYKVKCEGTSDGSLNLEDQFATRTVLRSGLRT